MSTSCSDWPNAQSWECKQLWMELKRPMDEEMQKHLLVFRDQISQNQSGLRDTGIGQFLVILSWACRTLYRILTVCCGGCCSSCLSTWSTPHLDQIMILWLQELLRCDMQYTHSRPLNTALSQMLNVFLRANTEVCPQVLDQPARGPLNHNQYVSLSGCLLWTAIIIIMIRLIIVFFSLFLFFLCLFFLIFMKNTLCFPRLWNVL